MNFLSKLQARYPVTAKPKTVKKQSADLERINQEYYPYPSEILPAIKGKRMLFIYSSRTSDIADMAVGGGDFTRGQIIEVIGDNYIVVKPDTPTYLRSKKKIAKGDHVLIGAVGVKKGVARSFVDKAENGLLYIGSMSGRLLEF